MDITDFEKRFNFMKAMTPPLPRQKEIGLWWKFLCGDDAALDKLADIALENKDRKEGFLGGRPK